MGWKVLLLPALWGQPSPGAAGDTLPKNILPPSTLPSLWTHALVRLMQSWAESLPSQQCSREPKLLTGPSC